MTATRTTLWIALFATTVGLTAIASSAEAATESRLFYQNGGNACTGALPTYEGALRKRPKAIANEGSSNAFVTCSSVGDDNGALPHEVYISFANSTGAPLQVSCTLVDGNSAYPTLTYPQTFMVPAGAVDAQSQWSPPEGSTTFSTPTLGASCSLPPGIALNFFGIGVDQEVGA